MYIKRNIDKYLIEWKKSRHHKPLLLRGARQIGKSTVVRNFGKQFEHYIEVNFEKDFAIKRVFESELPIKEIVARIGIIYDTEIVMGKTLLFLDEIQACPKAIHSLWFFKEDCPDLHVIAAGSLLELALNNMPTYGVGRIQSLFMYPLSFDEFLGACGHKKWLQVKQEATPQKPVPQELHNKLVELYRSFLLVGGMPASVVAWLENGDYLHSQTEQVDIITSYYDDFKKYAQKIDPQLLKFTMQSVLLQIGKKFVYSRVEGGYSIDDVKKALNFLCDAGIIHLVQHTSANGLPLGAEVNQKFRKYIFLDSGLLLCLLNLDLEGAKELTQDILTATAAELVNKGSLTEMVTGWELIKYALPKQKHDLFYWENISNGATSEVDYIVVKNRKIVPIEVKSGTSGKMKSLRLLMQKKQLNFAVRCSLENFAQLEDDNIDIFPLYAISGLYL